MSNLHSNWNDKLHAFSISEAGVAGNLAMNEFFGATDNSFNEFDLIRNLTNDENIVMLAVIGEEKELKLLHHPRNFGGKLTRKENKAVAFEGLSAEAVVGLLEAEKLTTFQAKQAPDAETLMDCTTKEELENLTTTQANRSNFLPVTILPPFLITALLEADLSDPLQLIPHLSQIAKKWDEDHADDEEVLVEASAEIGPFLRWLFVVGKKKIDGVSFDTNDPDAEMISYLKILTKAYLVSDPISTPNKNQTPNTMMVNVLSRLGEHLEESLEYKRKDHDRQEAKKDRVNKAHDSLVHMLKNAGSTDGIFPADDITPEARKFFNSENSGLADQTLYGFFEDDEISNVGFAPGLTLAVYNFNLLWNNQVYPRNLSVFSFTTITPDSEQKGRFLIMALGDKTGAGMKTEEEIKKATKQIVHVPTDYHGLVSSLKRFRTIVRVFYAGKPLLKWKECIENVEKLEASFTARAANDDKFVASFLYKLDKRLQEFLIDCRRLDDREIVNDRMLEFQHIIDDVRMGQFLTYLPPNFIVNDKKRKSNKIDDESTPTPAPVPSIVVEEKEEKRVRNELKIKA